MNILSKSAPIEQSIKLMEQALKNIDASYTFSCQKHPIQYCYSTNIISKESPNRIYANGKGTTQEACLASALGEYIERLQTNMFFADFYLPNRKYYYDQEEFAFEDDYLTDELKNIYDPHNELIQDDFIDFNSDIYDKIVCLPFQNLNTNKIVYFPLNILNTLYVSNGLATGNTKYEAITQALSEICERFVKIEVLKKSYSLPSYPKSFLEQFPVLNANISALENKGYIIDVLDASLGGKFPVVAISLINQQTNSLFVSFGSHPILEVALDRTMTELMQGRDLSSLNDFETPTFDNSQVIDPLNIESHYIDSNGKLSFDFLSEKKSFDFKSWEYESKTCKEDFEFLVNIIKSLDKEIYIREYQHIGFYSCQVLVPSFSEVYPIDDLIYNNKNRAKNIRNMVLNQSNYNINDILDEINSIEEHIDVGSYIGVIFKNKFNFLELKAHLYLKLKDYENAKELLITSDKKINKTISEMLELKLSKRKYKDYETALKQIFGVQNINMASEIISNKQDLIDKSLSKEYLDILNLFDRTLAKLS